MLIQRSKRSLLTFTVCIGLLMAVFVSNALSGDPKTAYYSADNYKIFWFIEVTDTHIGARGSQDSDNLLWLVSEGKNVVNPEFIVVSGDLTDSTNGNWLGLPNGPYQSEWDEYRSILSQGDVDSTNYYDLPGNHDAYSDQYFDYYRANSIQGQATNSTQVSWTRQFSYGKYHFLGVNTADNSGDPFSLSWPWGDYAGLDTDELSYIQDDLSLNSDADLTIVFGHHPLTDTGDDQDTWLYYGASDFVGLLDQNSASLYGYGHTHRYSEILFKGDAYTGYMAGSGLVYLNITSLGKSTDNNFSVIAIDCNGVSTKTQAMGLWPLVLITTPVDHDLGSATNPYSYAVPNTANNPIRALVFDAAAISQVQYRIDNDSQWYPMQPVAGNPYLWEAMWDGSAVADGGHTIQVQAVGSTVQSDAIAIQVASSNQPPVAQDQDVNTNEDIDIPILLTASDADGDTLEYQVLLPPAHGILEGSPPSLTYSPDADYFGNDSFTFSVFDGNAYSNEATVNVSIAPFNDPPAAFNDTYTVDQDQVLTIMAPGILANDTDVDGDVLTASLIDPPAHGTLDLSTDGAFSYTPDSGFVGTDSFTYVANDGSADSSPATVGITVKAVTLPDTTPPSPNPMTWGQAPQAIDDTCITMTATEATDPNGVEYYFECVSGGCHDSGWQASVVYMDTGLTASTPYTYVVRARDLSANFNTTTASAEAAATTAQAANQPPSFTSNPINEVNATAGVPYNADLQDDASDPNAGDTLTFSKVDGPSWLSVAFDGGLSGTPGAADVGVNQFTVRVADAAEEADTATLSITVNAAAEVNFYAESETNIRGTVAGSYLDTHADDDTYEKLTEEVKAGRWSVLEHTWTFTVSGSGSVVFLVQAHHTVNAEGDDFVFAFSLDNATFFDMVVVSNTSDTGAYYRFDLPPYTSGTIYVKVTDTDMSKGNVSPDTLFVDDMHIVTSSIAGMPAAAVDPNPADGATDIATNSLLNWSLGSNAQWHDVYFGTDPDNLPLVSEAQTAAHFDPGPLQEGTTYYWRVDEGNEAGTTAGVQWRFTTAAGVCTPTTVTVASISTDTTRGPAGTSYGQAVVLIIDNCGNPVAGASVTGYFTGDFENEATQPTDSNGEAKFVTTTYVKKPSFGFEVSDVVAADMVYLP
jgi:hypothetical protein